MHNTKDVTVLHRKRTMAGAPVRREAEKILKKGTAVGRVAPLLVAMAAAQDTHNNQVELSIRRQGRDQQVLPML